MSVVLRYCCFVYKGRSLFLQVKGKFCIMCYCLVRKLLCMLCNVVVFRSIVTKIYLKMCLNKKKSVTLRRNRIVMGVLYAFASV